MHRSGLSMYYTVLYLSISIALLTARAFQKRSRPQQLRLCRSLRAEALQVIVSEGLAQGPYVVARVGFEPMTIWLKGIDSINVPPCPIKSCLKYVVDVCYSCFTYLMLVVIRYVFKISAPIANSAMMSTLNVHCHREDETVRERTGHSPSHAKAKKMKSFLLHTRGCLRVN